MPPTPMEKLPSWPSGSASSPRRGESRPAAPGGAAPAPWEWVGLLLILAIGAWLRFSHLELLEFQRDEAHALALALQWLQQGKLPISGLVSSTGVTNPPLFVYLIAPLVAASRNPVAVAGGIALLNIAAVAICWHIGRRYAGAAGALTAAAMFAVSPWAVIFSRKIWAQDFIPIFATATLWAVHALCVGKRKRAIFWVVCLPLGLVQIHFSGLALVVTVAGILLWLRPAVDWRYAAAGVAVATVALIPYLKFQLDTGWADVQQFRHTVGGVQKWEQVQATLPGATVDPINGLRLPSRRPDRYALGIMNGGRIEDALGISADARHDPQQVYARKDGGGKPYFTQTLTAGDWLLRLQQVWFAAALAWLIFVAGRAIRGWRVTTAAGQQAWILVLWFTVPLLVFTLGRVWVFLPYFVVLYPIHFLASGVLAAKLIAFPRPSAWVVTAAVVAMLAGNVVYLNDYYRFVGQNGGAHGSQGTGVGYKQAAAKFLAERGGIPLQQESQVQIALALSRDPAERIGLAAQLSQPTLLQLNFEDRAQLPELEWPWLIAQATPGSGMLATGTAVLIVDGNREALQPEQLQPLEQFERVTFGPVRLYFTHW